MHSKNPTRPNIEALSRVGEWCEGLECERERALNDSVDTGRIYQEAVLKLTAIQCDNAGIPDWVHPEESELLTNVGSGPQEIRFPIAEGFMPTMNGRLRMRILDIEGDQTVIECKADRMILPPHFHDESEQIVMLDGEVVDAVTGQRYHAADTASYAPHKPHAPCAKQAHYLLIFTPKLTILQP